MTIEEKARAYDEALEKARKHYNSKYHPSEGPSGVYLNNADLEEIFPVLKESEDERIRRALIEVSREVAQKRFFINRGTTLEDALAYLEKHKDSDKAMSAIEKIDKYIDTHIANAHDMDDSNPDKKYYQGRDNALGEIAGILQDVYSNEKQKEHRDYNKLYEDIAKSEWFKKAYEGKSLDCNEQEEQKEETLSNFIDNFPYSAEQKVDIDKEKLIRHCIGLILTDATDERFKDYGLTLKDCLTWLDEQKEQKPKRERKKPKESWLSKLKYELAHEEELLIERGKELSEIGALKNKDQKEQKSSIVEKLREISTPADEDWFEIEKKWEAEDNEDLRPFISVKFASNAKVIDGKRFAVFTWERFKDIALELINRGKEKQKEQKPAEWNEEDKNKFDLLHTCIRHCINDHHWEYSKREKVSKEIIPFIEKLKSIRSQSKVEWSEEDEKMLERCISKMANIIPAPGKHGLEDMSFEKHTDEELAIWLESLPERFNLQPKQKWNKEDKIRLDSIISSYRELLQDYKTCHGVDYIPDTSDTLIRNVVDDVDFLKSLRPSWKPSKEQMKALKVVVSWDSKAYYMDGLESLYNDLQKLF